MYFYSHDKREMVSGAGFIHIEIFLKNSLQKQEKMLNRSTYKQKNVTHPPPPFPALVTSLTQVKVIKSGKKVQGFTKVIIMQGLENPSHLVSKEKTTLALLLQAALQTEKSTDSLSFHTSQQYSSSRC